MNKIVQLNFANNKRIDINNYKSDIIKAIDHASINLRRHNISIDLNNIKISKNGNIILNAYLQEDFNPGTRFKGIFTYLIKNYPKEIKSEDVTALFHNLPDDFEIRGETVISLDIISVLLNPNL